MPPLELCGQDFQTLNAIAVALCDRHTLDLYAISANLLPLEESEFREFLRLWERHARLNPAALLLEIEGFNELEFPRKTKIQQLVDRITSPLIVTSRDRLPPQKRNLFTVEVPEATFGEQQQSWHHILAPIPERERKDIIDHLTRQFNLTLNQIEEIGAISSTEKICQNFSFECPLIEEF